MQKFIPREKMSKKARRQLDNAQRQTWGINPVSRVTKDKKKYDRKALRRIDDDAELFCKISTLQNSHRTFGRYIHSAKAIQELPPCL